jgi:hypothetical protein
MNRNFTFLLIFLFFIIKQFFILSVSIIPGAMPFTLLPVSASSRASVLVRDSTPAFEDVNGFIPDFEASYVSESD